MVTPADLAIGERDSFLSLGFGLAISAVGLAGGWALEWILDGREPRE